MSELAVDRVVLAQVSGRLGAAEVVHVHDLQGWVVPGVPEGKAADPAESVHCALDGHGWVWGSRYGGKERKSKGRSGRRGRKEENRDRRNVRKQEASQLSQTRRILRLVPEYGILSMIDILRARTVING